MKSFKELNETELAELTTEGLETYIRMELMTQGIVEYANPGEYIGTPKPQLRTKTWYTFEDEDILYPDAKTAEKIMKMGVHIRRMDWRTGEYYAEPVKQEILMTEMSNEDDLTAIEEQWTRYRTEHDPWESKKNKYEQYLREHADVVRKMYNKVADAKKTINQHKKIRETYAEYMNITNNDDTMSRIFLAKVFTATEITEAIGEPAKIGEESVQNENAVE